ncbi:MAG: hypothetical protein ACN6OP_19730, partial [Pseudomonadales bacterium]
MTDFVEVKTQDLAGCADLMAERDQLKAAIETPESVFLQMKAGSIPKPTIRSMVDLYGEVVNGDEAQLLEIARLRAELGELKAENERLADACEKAEQIVSAESKAAAIATGCVNLLQAERDRI